MQFKKATKKQSKLRLAIFGPSGSGKTYSALSIASGMGDKIAFVDTERGSASKYADRFNFDVVELDVPTVANVSSLIDQAAGYEVLIIDSLSHAWQQLLEEVDRIAKAKFNGNTWSAWSEGGPLQRKLIDSILKFDGHIIATMRVKTDWVVAKDDRTGKSRPEKVGLSPEQGKGIEYEFDMLMEISPEHYATVSKDRTGRFQDRVIEKPGESVGHELIDWLNDGIDLATAKQVEDIKNIIRSQKMDLEKTREAKIACEIDADTKLNELTREQADDLIEHLCDMFADASIEGEVTDDDIPL